MRKFPFSMTLEIGGRSGLTVQYGDPFIADDVVTFTSPAGLEFGVLKTVWEE